MHTQPESADKPVFFSQIQPITQTTVIECKNRFVYALCAYEISCITVVEFYHKFAFNNKALKMYVEFRIC